MTEDEKLESEIENHLVSDINWFAYKNDVIKTANKNESARGDVEQFAADSFFHGWQAAKKYFQIKNKPE